MGAARNGVLGNLVGIGVTVFLIGCGLAFGASVVAPSWFN
jgi:hypothetical protein